MTSSSGQSEDRKCLDQPEARKSSARRSSSAPMAELTVDKPKDPTRAASENKGQRPCAIEFGLKPILEFVEPGEPLVSCD